MKITFKLMISLIFILNTLCAQTGFSEYSLLAKDPKAIKKSVKQSWTIKTILTNHSSDTLFYYTATDCEAAYYSIDTMGLYVDFPQCDMKKQSVTVIPPSAQKIVELKMTAVNPLKYSVYFKVLVYIYKAQETGDPKNRFSPGKVIPIFSNRLKT
jgi:hypothetical protein